jgi:DNA-binding transcriptional MerR regulator
MKIGDVAVAAGVNIQTLRYYERRGLLEAPARTDSGHRIYDADAVRVVRFVKGAQSLGFTLEEVESLLELRSEALPRRDVRRLAQTRLAEVERKIAQLEGIRSTLGALIRECEAGRPGPCPILHAMDGAEVRAPSPRLKVASRRAVRRAS